MTSIDVSGTASADGNLATAAVALPEVEATRAASWRDVLSAYVSLT